MRNMFKTKVELHKRQTYKYSSIFSKKKVSVTRTDIFFFLNLNFLFPLPF
jgi:hypothetical protein